MPENDNNNNNNNINDQRENGQVDFNDINRIISEARAREEALKTQIEQDISTKNIKFLNYDKERYRRKFELRQLIEKWQQEGAGIPGLFEEPEFMDMIQSSLDYALMDVAATHSYHMDEARKADTGRIASKELVQNNRDREYLKRGYKNEVDAFNLVFRKIETYIQRMDEKARDDNFTDAEKNRYLMAANLLYYFDNQRSGSLEPAPDDAILVNEKEIQLIRGEKQEISRAEEPLFPHEPSPNDLKQGELGDCYMISSLSAIAAGNPQAIKDCMRDNGNGTVTVRLYQRFEQPEREEDWENYKEFRPIYVTVNKSVPERTTAQNCLWAALIERAYIVAGKGLDSDRLAVYTPPRPDNMEERYQTYKSMPKDKRPTNVEDPWFFDKDDKLYYDETISYEMLDIGGNPDHVFSTILGPTHDTERRHNKLVVYEFAKETVYNQLRRVIEKETNEDYVTQLEALMGNLPVDKKVANMISIAAVLLDPEQAFSYREFPLRLDKEGNIRALPKTSFREPLKKYCDNLRKNVFEGKRTAEKKVISMDELLTKTLETTHYGTQKKWPSQFDIIRNKMEQDRTDFADDYGKRYPQAYLDLYGRIAQLLENGSHICASTPPNPYQVKHARGDERLKFGLNYRHGYSVIGVQEHEIDGKTHKFVVLRNPHGGNKSPDYDFKKEPPEPKNGDSNLAEGIFLVELRHFAECMDNLYVAKKVENPENRKRVEHPLTSKTASVYRKLFNKLEHDWKYAKGDFEFLRDATYSYEKIKIELNSINVKIGQNIGKEMSQIPLDYLEEQLKEHKEKYFESKGSKEGSYKVADKILKVIKMLRHNMADPEKDIRNTLSGGILHEDKSLKDLLTMYDEHELGLGAKYSVEEAEKLEKLAKDADPTTLISSKQYGDIRKALKTLTVSAEKMKSLKTAGSFDDYTKKLGTVLERCNDYLLYKREQRQVDGNDKIIAQSSREAERIDTVMMIQAYAQKKKEIVEKECRKMLLAEKLYAKTEYEQKVDLRMRTKEIYDLSGSRAFLDAVKNLSAVEIQRITDSEENMKRFCDKYRQECGDKEAEKYLTRQEQIFGEGMKHPKKNRELVGNTVAKMLYGHFFDRTKNEPDRNAILKDESRYIEAIKRTGTYQFIMEEQLKSGLPVFLEEKLGKNLITACKAETAIKLEESRNRERANHPVEERNLGILH